MAQPIQPREPDKGAEPIQPRETAPNDTLKIQTPDAETQVIVVEEPAPKKRRTGLRWLIALLVIAVLLVVAVIVAEILARQYAENYVRELVVDSLPVSPETPLDVQVNGGPVLLQALAGSMTEITVGIPEFTVGEISGSAAVVATGVPLDGTLPTEGLDIVVTFPESSVQALSGYLSGIDLDSIEVGNGLITVATSFEVLFITLPVSVGLVPSADPGGIAFTPEVITLEQQEISVDDLRNNPLVSGLAGSLLNSQVFCIAESLPQGFTVTDVSVQGTDLVATVSGDGVALGGPDLLETGTCP